ncbi:unnamed protein product [Oreochromis niloticus]|nr:unnamed protein product [Mustela putorius furo]
MELLQLLLPALFFVSVFSEGSIPYVKVMLGDSFILPGNCESEEDGKLHQTQPQSRDVAGHRHRVWTPEKGREETAVQVEVVVFSESSVTEGEALSLSCYYPTTAGTCWSVRWVKDGEDVLRRDSCDGNSDWTADGRLSVS